MFGAKAVCSASRAARPLLWLPLEGKLRPQAVMRCRLRVAEPFTGEKVTLCFVTRYRATPQSVVVPQAELPATFPSKGKAHCRVLFCRQRFYDCVARSLRHSLLVQRNAGRIRLRGICARKHAQGTAPRSEPRFAPADRDEIKSRGSMRLRPPETPRRTGKTGEVSDRGGVQSGESFCIRGKRRLFSDPRE